MSQKYGLGQNKRKLKIIKQMKKKQRFVQASYSLFVLVTLLVSLILEHYTRKCDFGNFDKIKNKNNTKNTKSFG